MVYLHLGQGFIAVESMKLASRFQVTFGEEQVVHWQRLHRQSQESREGTQSFYGSEVDT